MSMLTRDNFGSKYSCRELFFLTALLICLPLPRADLATSRDHSIRKYFIFIIDTEEVQFQIDFNGKSKSLDSLVT